MNFSKTENKNINNMSKKSKYVGLKFMLILKKSLSILIKTLLLSAKYKNIKIAYIISHLNYFFLI